MVKNVLQGLKLEEKQLWTTKKPGISISTNDPVNLNKKSE